MALKLSASVLPTSFALSSICRSPWRLQGSVRTLFSQEAMGVDGYTKQRNRTGTQFKGMEDKFRAKMAEFAVTNSKNMIFTEDLKNMVHLVQGNVEDLSLVHQMMKRFNQQNKHLRFGNFTFGPVIMRMYYHLNEPTQALAVFNDPELDGFFDQMVSHQILCDLLYRNEMYQQIMDVFEVTKLKQMNGIKFPRNVTTLVMASCHKLNTPESYEFAIQILNDMKEVGAEPNRRTICYATALALEQNSPQVALEILSLSRTSNYVTIRNLKVLALIDLNRIDDSLPVLRHSIENESPDPERKISVCPDVLEKLSTAIDNLGNKEISLEFQRIHKALVETKQIAPQTLAEILDQEMERQPRDNNGPGGFGRQDFRQQSIDKSFRPGRAMNFRPNKNPSFNRERQSLRYEY